jgi:hypothetical protein
MIDERDFLTGSVRLEKLERRFSVLIERSDLAVDGHFNGGQ